MANDAYTQQALALDPRFRTRVRNALSKVAWVVLLESTGVANHTIRANYARLVLQNLDGIVAQIAPWLVGRTNVVAFATTWDPPSGAIVTAAGDADLESQLTTDWNYLAGVA
jgi:hypothetical protein